LQDHELSRIVEYVSHPYTPPIGSNLETGHHGVDFSYYTKDGIGPPIDNNPIQSMLNGRVAGIGINRLPYGNMLVIETPFENLPLSIKELFGMQAGTSLYLLYAHMLEAPIFSIGDPVSCADLIGIVGNSGFSGNPHLHLESRVGPSGLDLPTMIFYETTATLAEQAAYTEWRVGDTFTKHDPTLFLNLAGEQ
jgi:murein DD-endopeptidase MepM/ murein hydrolase activator NlpD